MHDAAWRRNIPALVTSWEVVTREVASCNGVPVLLPTREGDVSSPHTHPPSDERMTVGRSR